MYLSPVQVTTDWIIILDHLVKSVQIFANSKMICLQMSFIPHRIIIPPKTFALIPVSFSFRR